MAEENEKKVAELEEKLEKARNVYKDLKGELTKANERIAELESQGVPDTENEVEKSLKERIKELEDEIEINGKSSEEIKTLNARLEKAKQVFGEQKAKIKELTDEIENCKHHVDELEESFANVTREKTGLLDSVNALTEVIVNAVEKFKAEKF